MTTLQILHRILKTNFDLEPDALTPDARLADLEIDSLATVEVLFAVEDEFKVTVPPEPAAQQTRLETVGDLVAYVDRLVAEQAPVGDEGAPA
ncbi:MAG: acyl carrier protein [Casimicrobiaceae bacterium]